VNQVQKTDLFVIVLLLCMLIRNLWLCMSTNTQTAYLLPAYKYYARPQCMNSYY
jgi:hypothetical protein